MPPATTIECVTLKLDKTIKGDPKSITMSCVMCYNDRNMGIGYVLGVDETIVELRCSNLGILNQHSFMNTDVVTILVGPPIGGTIVSFRLGFTEKEGEWSGFMMQGKEGGAIIATSNFKEDTLADFQQLAGPLRSML